MRTRLPDIGSTDAGQARKSAIARSFDAAANDYDAHAEIQRRAARNLATRIGALSLPAGPAILEIGCGTGILSADLAGRFPGARFLFTDLSRAMAQRCRAKIARRHAGGQFAVMDGEFPAVAPVFDLIVSSFAFQWFLDLPAAMARLSACLRPGGQLAFATMGAGSLSEWQELHAAAGVPFSGLAFPDARDLLGMAEQARLRGRVAEERMRRRHPDAFAFLRELKSLGAGTPRPEAPAMKAADLRRVLREADSRRAFTVTYQVLYGTFTAPLAAR